jgi:hypothetical protein
VDHRALEVFAGSKNLSSDLAKNFTLPRTVASVIDKIRGGVYRYVPLAPPPHDVLSRARFPAARPHVSMHMRLISV